MEDKLRQMFEENVPDISQKIKRSQEYEEHFQNLSRKPKVFFLAKKSFQLAMGFSVFLLFLSFFLISPQTNHTYALEMENNGYSIEVLFDEDGNVLDIKPLNEETKQMLLEIGNTPTLENLFKLHEGWKFSENENIPQSINEQVQNRITNANERRNQGRDNNPNKN